MVVGYGFNQVLRMASNLVLARLLVPEHFGLMVLVNVFIQGLTMFSDIGVGPSIIRSKRGDEQAFLDTAWTVQAARGLCLWGLTWLLAPLIAGWYGEPELSTLLPVAGLTALLTGLDSTKLITASRHLLLGRRMLIELASQAVSIGVMVVWALLQPSVWSLVAGGIANSATKAVLSQIALPGPRNRPYLERGASVEILTFGRWIFVSTAITFLAMQIDRLLLGKLIPLDSLGVYGMAQQLTGLPTLVLGMLVGSIVFPLLSSSARSAPESLRARAQGIRAVLLPCAALAILAVALLGPAFFRTLYDERYAAASWMVVMLLVPLWFLALTQSADRVLLVLGDTRSLATCNAISLVGKVLGCLGGFRLAGLPGFILGSTLGTAAGHAVVQLALSRRGVSILRQDVHWTLLLGGLSVVGWWIPSQVAAAFGAGLRTPAELVVAASLLTPLALLAARRVRARRTGA